MDQLLTRLGLTLPILQAPMAGISTPEMAAAVSNAGGLGAIGVGNLNAEQARQMIQATRVMTSRPFNVNVFCHRPATVDARLEASWRRKLAPTFTQFGAAPSARLREIYRSFVEDAAMLEMLLEQRPAVVSFHFGLPAPATIDALHDAGILLLATATSLPEGQQISAAGIDAIVAQGYEAGGHRGVFDPAADDDRLETIPLLQRLDQNVSAPIIAAGGIMNGRAMRAALDQGAIAAQLGTAFLLTPESAADEAYRQKLQSPAAQRTTMVRALSGRIARSLPNAWTEMEQGGDLAEIPDYPLAYDAAKSLHAAAKSCGDFEYGAQWAGAGAPLVRAITTAELMAQLQRELSATACDGAKSGRMRQ